MSAASQQLLTNCMRKSLTAVYRKAREPRTYLSVSGGCLAFNFVGLLGSYLHLYTFTAIICNNCSLVDMGEDGAGSDDYDPHADPKADPRERRRIRYEYRELIAETQSKLKSNATAIYLIFPSCYSDIFYAYDLITYLR